MELNILHAVAAHKAFAPHNWHHYSELIDATEKKIYISERSLSRNTLKNDSELIVMRALDRLGLKYERSKVIMHYYTPDILVAPNVVIEVDGPSHFLRTTDGKRTTKLDGRSQYATELYEANGFKVIRIPYNQLENAEEILKQHLR